MMMNQPLQSTLSTDSPTPSTQHQESLWLSSKLNAEWSAEKIASQLNVDVLKHMVEDNYQHFHYMDTAAKVQLLLSILSLKKKPLSDMSPFYQMLFDSSVQNEQEDEWVRVVSEMLSLFPNYHVLKSNLQYGSNNQTGGESFEKTLEHLVNLCNISRENKQTIKPLYTKFLQQDDISNQPANIQTELEGDRWSTRIQQHSHFKLKIQNDARRDALLNPIRSLSEKDGERPPSQSNNARPKKINTKLPASISSPSPGNPSTPQSAKTPSFIRKSAPPAHTALAQKKSPGVSNETRGLKQIDESEAIQRLKQGATNDRRRTSYIRTPDVTDPEKERRKKERIEAKEKKEQEKITKKKQREEDKKRKQEEQEKKKEERKRKKDERPSMEPDRKRQRPNPPQHLNSPASPATPQIKTQQSASSPFAFAPQQISPLMNPFGLQTPKLPTVTTQQSTPGSFPMQVPSAFPTIPSASNTPTTFSPFGSNSSLSALYQFPGLVNSQNGAYAFSPSQNANGQSPQQARPAVSQKSPAQLPQTIAQPSSPHPQHSQLQQQKVPASNPLQQHPQQQPQPKLITPVQQQQQTTHESQRMQLDNYIKTNLLKGCNRISADTHQQILNFLSGKTDASQLPDDRQIEQVLIHEEANQHEIHQIYFQMDHKQKTWKKYLKKIQNNGGPPVTES